MQADSPHGTSPWGSNIFCRDILADESLRPTREARWGVAFRTNSTFYPGTKTALDIPFSFDCSTEFLTANGRASGILVLLRM